MKADRRVIQGKMDIIDQNLQFLQEARKTPYPAFEKSLRDILAVKHALQECIEASVDIGNHIIAAEGFRRAEDYRDIFTVIGENKLVSSGLQARLGEMAQFRNVLVHRYAEIQTRRLYDLLQRDIADIEEFVRVVLNYLKKKR